MGKPDLSENLIQRIEDIAQRVFQQKQMNEFVQQHISLFEDLGFWGYVFSIDEGLRQKPHYTHLKQILVSLIERAQEENRTDIQMFLSGLEDFLDSLQDVAQNAQTELRIIKTIRQHASEEEVLDIAHGMMASSCMGLVFTMGMNWALKQTADFDDEY